MFCRSCGEEIPNDAVVCVKCGRATGVPIWPAPAVKSGESSGLMIAGFITAVLAPIAGLIIGIILLAKSKIGAGLGVVILSIISWVLWLAILAS